MPPPSPVEPPSDEQLLLALQARDEAALRQLYDRYAGELYALCLRIVRDPTAAQTLLSDIFYELWQKADRFNPQRGGVRTYLVMLCRSRAIDYQRSQSIRKVHETMAAELRTKELRSSVHADEPWQHLASTEQHAEVRQVLAQLSTGQRATLELAYFEGLSHQQIADLLELPLGTVKTNIRQGLARMRSALGVTKPGAIFR